MFPEPLPKRELQALQDLYIATNGPNWIWYGHGSKWHFPDARELVNFVGNGSSILLEYHARYGSESPNANPCYEGWEGVMCSCNMSKPSTIYDNYNPYYGYYDDQVYLWNATSTGNVANCSIVKLFLNHHNLQGNLPESLGQLSYLTHLHLDNNLLSGSFPSIIFTMSAIQSISISKNYFTGTIPTAIGQLYNLNMLEITYNQLTGTIPWEIGLCTALVDLALLGNKLTGSIPASMGNLTRLQFLDLHYNYLTHSIPSSFSALTNLEGLDVFSNMLSSTIPSLIGQWPSIFFLSFGANDFTGNMPTEFFQLSQLIWLELGSNPLSPSPLSTELTRLSKLEHLGIENGHVVGSIPPCIGTLRHLMFLSLYGNQLSGPLPAELYSLTNLVWLSIHSNYLSGEISGQISTLTNLVELDLYNNLLSQQIPSTLSVTQCSNLRSLSISFNKLRGPIPFALFGNSDGVGSSVNSLRNLDLSNNELTSSIPPQIGLLSQLHILSLSSNQLTGVMPSELFQSMPQLQVLSLSLNCFDITSLSTDICNASALTTLIFDGLAAAPACRGHSSLGGLSSLSSALLGSAGSSSYTLYGNELSSLTTIPYCLLTMPHLTSLHLSGNGLFGNLNEYLTYSSISPNLTDLVLSHNYLSGPIPEALQSRSTWKTLDLSFNEFSGTLESDMTLQSDAILSLQVNRLSGAIPLGLLSLTHVSILEGNGFDCLLSTAESSLPGNDPYASKTICGSNEFDVAVVTWGCSLLTVVLLYALIRRRPTCSGRSTSTTRIEDGIELATTNYSQQQQPAVSDGSRYFITDFATELLATSESLSMGEEGIQRNSSYTYRSSIYALATDLFDRATGALRLGILKLVVLISLFLIIYGTLKGCGYSNIAEEYAFVVSAAHLSGSLPGILLAVLYFGSIVICNYLFNRCLDRVLYADKGIAELMNKLTSNKPQQQSDASSNASESPGWFSFRSRWHMWCSSINEVAKYAAMGILNFIIVAVVNGAYISVYLNRTFSRSILIVISILMSVFKLTWMQVVLPNTVAAISSRQSAGVSRSGVVDRVVQTSRNMSFMVVIVVINTIVIPCLAVILVSPQCLLYALSASPVVQTSYQLPICSSIFDRIANGTLTNIQCSNYEEQTLLLEYEPPFLYSYQCSDSLLTSYASVFVFMFTISTFILPTLTLGMSWLMRRMRRTGSNTALFTLLVAISPLYLVPVEHLSKDRLPQLIMKFFQRLRRSRTTSSTALSERASVVVNPIIVTPSPSVDSTTRTSDQRVKLLIRKSIFSPVHYVIQFAQVMSILLSFGVIFPPLAWLACLSIISQSLVLQYSLRKFVLDLEDNQFSHYWKVVNDDCDVATILVRHCVGYVFPASSVLLAIFLFDIMGGMYPGAFAYAATVPCVFLFAVFTIYAIGDRLNQFFKR